MITEIQNTDEIVNANSHHWGNVDDCVRCVDCEIGIWNAWKEYCNAV